MKIYIYEYLEVVSESYHEGGGAIIITDDSPQEAWKRHFAKQKYIADQVLPGADYALEVEANHELVIVFPDAGCC